MLSVRVWRRWNEGAGDGLKGSVPSALCQSWPLLPNLFLCRAYQRMDGSALPPIDPLPNRNAISKAPRAAGYRGSDFVHWHPCPVWVDRHFRLVTELHSPTEVAAGTRSFDPKLTLAPVGAAAQRHAG
jgi:hypothetical protein